MAVRRRYLDTLLIQAILPSKFLHEARSLAWKWCGMRLAVRIIRTIWQNKPPCGGYGNGWDTQINMCINFRETLSFKALIPNGICFENIQCPDVSRMTVYMHIIYIHIHNTCIYLSIYQSIYQSINQSIYQSINQSIYESINQSINL